MTEQLRERLNDFGERLVNKLIADIQNKRVTKFGAVNASGDLAKSVRFELFEVGLRVYAFDYIYYLRFGRKPGKFPPKQDMMDWIDDKPIRFNASEITKESLAFLIGRSIAKKGTTIYQQGGSDLVSGIVDSDFFDSFINDLQAEFIQEIISEFNVT